MLRAILKGIGGCGSGVMGWVITNMDRVDYIVRIAAGALGAMVALATLVSSGLDIRRKLRGWALERRRLTRDGAPRRER